jgi:hypothetical protein
MQIIGMQVAERQRVLICPMQQTICEQDIAFVVTFSIFQAMELSLLPITDDELTSLNNLNKLLRDRSIQ